MVQFNDFTHVCRYTCVLAHLMHAKLLKLVCAHTVVHNLGVCTWLVNTHDTRDAHHKLTLGLPHYTCSVVTGTVVAGNKMQLFCN